MFKVRYVAICSQFLHNDNCNTFLNDIKYMYNIRYHWIKTLSFSHKKKTGYFLEKGQLEL